jgi:hypothetical protein
MARIYQVLKTSRILPQESIRIIEDESVLIRKSSLGKLGSIIKNLRVGVGNLTYCIIRTKLNLIEFYNIGKL